MTRGANTTPGDPMGDTFLASLLQRLDFVVIERLPSGSLRFETPAPRWFVDVATTASGGDPVTLGGALPFVHHVLEDAEAFWWSGKDGVATGDPFVASGAAEEYLLRPRAVSLSGRKLLVIERLSGLADARSVMQAAREGRLKQERLQKKVEAIRAPADEVVRLAGELLDSGLTPAQRERAQGAVRAAERLRASLD